jgi:hypothetical protein
MGVPPVPVSGVPWAVLRAVGVAVPFAREIVGVRHQFDQEFVIDATATTETLGVAPTPWDDVVPAAWGHRLPCGEHADTVVGMGLFSAWVLVALTALAAIGCAVPAWRLTRRERVADRPGRAR